MPMLRGRSRRPVLTTRIAALGACACAATGISVPHYPDDPPATGATTPLAIVDVRVVTMLSAQVMDHQTVLIRDGTIEWIGPVGARTPPPDAAVIPGSGRFVMPALIDMHVHLRAADLPAYLDNGIATVRNMWGHPAVAQLMTEVASGTRPGPTIYSASQGLDGTPPQWPFTVIVTQPESARAAVLAQRAAGWSWLKVYTRLSPAVFDSVMAAARDAGLTPIGHVPFSVDVRVALAQGMRSIEHLTGYDRAVSRNGSAGTWGWIDVDPARYGELVRATVAAGAWNCPTLAIFSELAKQHSAAERVAVLQNRRRFVKELFDAGAPILLGTDAGIDIVPAGTSIHDELAELVAAGLTPLQALRAGTTEAARFLGRSDLGVVAASAEASLLLVSGNPLDDVGNVKRMSGMVLRGAWRPAGPH
ncbi:MAG TPA: amidohydrolase family protein [Gemmatimonadales bacterium]|nr:amidohydrolase family protein [Gemmatimonadales bacterium]